MPFTCSSPSWPGRKELSPLSPWRGNYVEHLALLLADPFMEGDRHVAGEGRLDGAAGSARQRPGDHMVHVISPRHFAVIRYAGPHPQASRPARPPHRSAPLPRLPGARQPHHHRAIAAQLLRAAAHIVLLDAHPFRLALDRAATAACAGPLMTPTTPATADADKELPRHAQARTCWSAGPHGRCPCSSAGSSDRTLARTDIWRTGPAAKTTAGHICAGQEPYRRIRTSGL